MKKKTYLLRAVVYLLCLVIVPNVVWGITIEVPTEGTLEKVIDDSDEPSFQTLKIVGRLNATDIAYLRTGTSRLSSIQVLDLSDVTLVSGDEPYATVKWEPGDGLMSNATATFYIADENRMESSYQSNMMGGRNYTYKYYSNNLAGAFAQMKYLQVVLPKGQKEIGDYSFYKCENLTSVILDGNVERIGESAFEGCSSLQDMDLSHVTEMGSCAFAYCPVFRGNETGFVNLSSLNSIPASIFNMKDGDGANKAIKSILFSEQLTEIGTYAFSDCQTIESIQFPEGLLTIGNGAFSNCNSLNTVTIPSTVTGLSASVFANTPFINNLPAENGVVYLGTTALYYKGEIKDFDLVIREGTTEIGASFLSSYRSYASYLKSVQLPLTLKRIGNSVFSEAKQLTSITLPEGLEEIGSYAFNGCTGIESLALPSTLKVIGDYAFQGMEKLTTIVLPDALESIGSSAFDGCKISGEVTIPANVKQLGTGIFGYSNNIWQIRYNAVNAEHIYTDNYQNAIFKAERVIIGSGVQKIPDQAFKDCSSLKKITFEERTDDAELIIGKSCFYYSSITEIELPKGKIEIDGGAFGYCNQLASFSTLGVVTKIGDAAFEHTKLTEFTVPDGLTYVGANAFHYPFFISSGEVSALTTVHLGNNVKYIGESAFAYCNALTDIQFGDQVEIIGRCAFISCSSLTSFTIPNGVTEIEESAFSNCPFTEITIPANVKSIGKWAFQSCTQLTAVHVAEGLEEIGEEAFSNCDLREFTLPSTIKALGNNFLGGHYESASPNMTDIYALMPVPLEMSESDYPFSTAYLYNSTQDISHYGRCVLHVPSGSLQQYRETYPWSRFKTIVEIEEDESDYALTVDNIKCSKAKTTMLTVSLKNKEVLAGLQFELVLPSGVIVAEDENPERPVVLTERGDGLSVMHSKNENGGYTFLIVSLSGSKISGDEGALLNIPLYVSDNVPEGEHQIMLKQIFATTENGKTRYFKQAQATMSISSLDYILGDANGDGNVNVTDIVETVSYILNKPSAMFIFTAADVNQDGIVNVTDIVNMVSIIMSPANTSTHAVKIIPTGNRMDALQVEHIEVEDVVLSAGEEKSIAIELVNPERLYSAFQFDLVLPEGISIATNSKGRLVASLDAERMEDHSLSVEKIGDNTYRFVAFSLTNAEFYGNSGTLVNLTLKAADNLTKDAQTAQIVAQSFTTKNAVQYNLAGITFAIMAPADPITITAKSYTREYGDQNPVFEYTSEGADLNGTPAISCAATPTSPVGTYPIIISKGSVTNDNDTYVNGTLTITKAPLTITAESFEIKQGDVLPNLTIQFKGFKNDEDESVLTSQPVVTCTATSGSKPGIYDIVVSGANALNYDIDYVAGRLIILAADPIVITAKSYSREYGEENPTFEYMYTGAELRGAPTITCAATASSPVGTYPIVINKGSVTNYNDTYVNGTLTITKAPLNVSVGNYSRKENEENPVFELIYQGWRLGETESVLTQRPTATTTATSNSPRGEYPIVVSGGSANNYSFTYVNGVLTVEEATGISQVTDDGVSFDVYTTTGMLVLRKATTLKGLPAGIYIVNGKKVLIK